MKNIVKKIEEEVSTIIGTEGVEATISIAGQSGGSDQGQLKIGDFYGQINVKLTIFSSRDRSAKEIMNLARPIVKKHPELKINFSVKKIGPPVGPSFYAEIKSSSDFSTDKIISKIIKILNENKLTTDIETSF